MVTKKATTPAKSQSQKERFIAKAKELGASENEKAFNAALKKIGRAKITGNKDSIADSKK